jgi:GNAT superfamily N-acetyltransferase
MASTGPAPKLKVKEVSSELWADFEKLFEAKGSPKYCWCMAWRADQKDPRSKSGAGRKALMKKLVAGDTPVGLIGYLDGEPVAWCSLAPFDTFRGLRKTQEPTDKVWSVTCFFVRREHRDKGLTKQMLAAAVRHARKRGAKIVEGYGVARSSPSYRHMGFIGLFKGAGFEEVGREGTRRHVMQLPTRRSRRDA